jgi:RNA polymerase sigma-70 factor, ECF subfamily
MQKNDEILVENFLAGDEAAFESLLERYLRPIYNFLYQLTSERSALDDLTQITFVKAWKNMHRFDQSRSFKTWLYSIAKNTAYDYFKKKKTVPFSFFESTDGYNKLEEIEEDAALPDELLEKKDLAKELEKKLEEIPKPYKIILMMHYKDDLSLSEISEILGVPYNTIKSQHQRALLALRKKFVK